MEPLISVVIPAYNSGNHLRATVESVLAQPHRPLEVLIVDDGSTDGTAGLAASFGAPVKVLRQERSGHPAARNTGIRAARGEFLAFVDHDDLWSPCKLALQLACFREDDRLDLVFGHTRNFFSGELTNEECASFRAPMMPLPGLLQGAMLAKRDSFLRVGMFDEEKAVGDFIDWYGRAKIAGMRTRIPSETVLYRRIHRGNHQRRNRNMIGPGYLRAVKNLLDRRRLGDSL